MLTLFVLPYLVISRSIFQVEAASNHDRFVFPARFGIENPSSSSSSQHEDNQERGLRPTSHNWHREQWLFDGDNIAQHGKHHTAQIENCEEYHYDDDDVDLFQEVVDSTSFPTYQHGSPTESFFDGLDDEISIPEGAFSDKSNTSDLQALDIAATENTLESSFRSSQRRLPAYSWQKDIPKEILRKIHRTIISLWPKNLDKNTGQKWDRYISRYLDKHPEIVQGLLEDSPVAWESITKWSDPEAMIKRSASHGRQKGTEKRFVAAMSVSWLAGTISSTNRRKILTRLSKQWGILREEAIQHRLETYANNFGKIQSPEPLLGPDDRLFRKAADIIFYSSDRRKRDAKHPEAGLYDILHQYSPEYSVMNSDGQVAQIPFERKHKKPSAKRYHTPHTWMDKLTTTQIDYIHDAIASHWIDDLNNTRKSRYLIQVNEHLENSKGAVEKILEGDDHVAWKMAKRTAEQAWCMKSYEEYRPVNMSCSEASTSQHI